MTRVFWAKERCRKQTYIYVATLQGAASAQVWHVCIALLIFWWREAVETVGSRRFSIAHTITSSCGLVRCIVLEHSLDASSDDDFWLISELMSESWNDHLLSPKSRFVLSTRSNKPVCPQRPPEVFSKKQLLKHQRKDTTQSIAYLILEAIPARLS